MSQIVLGQAEDVVADHVDARALRTWSIDFVDFFLIEALVDVGSHAVLRRFDAERQPVEAGLLQLVQHAILDRVDAGIGPDIQVVAALDDPVADAQDVPALRTNISSAILMLRTPYSIDQDVDLADDACPGSSSGSCWRSP